MQGNAPGWAQTVDGVLGPALPTSTLAPNALGCEQSSKHILTVQHRFLTSRNCPELKVGYMQGLLVTLNIPHPPPSLLSSMSTHTWGCKKPQLGGGTSYSSPNHTPAPIILQPTELEVGDRAQQGKSTGVRQGCGVERIRERQRGTLR